jgi:hypothetical protein
VQGLLKNGYLVTYLLSVSAKQSSRFNIAGLKEIVKLLFLAVKLISSAGGDSITPVMA